MRNSKTTKELYEQLLLMPDLHSKPRLEGEILIWNLYSYAYVRAYCDSYDTCIDVISTSASVGSLVHWHPDEDDMFDELYALGKEGNILVLKKYLLGTGVFYMGEPQNYPFERRKKRHWGKLTYMEQKCLREDLVNLTDDQLFEKIYFENLDFVELFDNEETALFQMSSEQRVVYILSVFDMEIMNGGLCQFFVNSSRLLAPFVDECLETVKADEYRNLFSAFVENNNLDLYDLESFEIMEAEDFSAQAHRCDFDAFNNTYCEFTPLQEYITAYIKNNISEF